VKAAVAQATSALGANGRVLLRASGTEPLIRVMVEGKSRPQVTALADSIAAAVRKAARRPTIFRARNVVSGALQRLARRCGWNAKILLESRRLGAAPNLIYVDPEHRHR